MHNIYLRTGGQLGYLAIVIEATEYNIIANAAPFLRRTDTGTFSVTQPIGVRGVPLTVADIIAQKIDYDERKRLYNECQGVEVALRNQISEAIEDDYLEPLRDSTTDVITCTIREIFTFLRDNYMQLSPAELKERE